MFSTRHRGTEEANSLFQQAGLLWAQEGSKHGTQMTGVFGVHGVWWRNEVFKQQVRKDDGGGWWGVGLDGGGGQVGRWAGDSEAQKHVEHTWR